MKFELEAAVLLSAAKTAGLAVENRSIIPILGFLHLDARNDKISLRGTNLDVEIGLTTPANIDKAGTTAIPAKLLTQILAKLPKGAHVKLEQKEKGKPISLQAGRSRFSLQTLPPEDFPEFPVKATNHTFTLARGDLAKLFETVQFAICTEQVRYYLNGAYLHVTGKEGEETLRAVATDGHKLASSEIPAPAGAVGMPGVIVPSQTVSRVLKMTEGHDQIDVALSETRITFSAGEMVLSSKLIDGTFPDYPRVVPLGNDKIVKASVKELTTISDRVSTISSERGRAVKLDLEKGSLKLSVSNPGCGAAEETMEVEYEGVPLTIGFNSRYLTEILGEIEGDAVVIKMADPGSPTLFVPDETASTFFVLMPMRT